jgi:hypothetical protein
MGQTERRRRRPNRPRTLASWRVLTNRMREYFTYGSVGGAGGNPGSYPASNGDPRIRFEDGRADMSDGIRSPWLSSAFAEKRRGVVRRAGLDLVP